MGNLSPQTNPDPFADKVSRTVIGQYVRFKRKRLNCIIHAIFDEDAGFLYAPIQKVACSSIKASIIEHFCSTKKIKRLEPKHKLVHKYFWSQPQFWIPVETLTRSGLFKFCVVRDPVDRFISGYRNRILDNEDLIAGRTRAGNGGDLPKFPDIDFFALHLAEYCAANDRIDWHFRPQADIIGAPAAFDRIYDISDIEKLYSDLKANCGVTLTAQRQNVSRAPEPTQLSAPARQAVKAFYAADYDAFAQAIRPRH